MNVDIMAVGERPDKALEFCHNPAISLIFGLRDSSISERSQITLIQAINVSNRTCWTSLPVHYLMIDMKVMEIDCVEPI